MFLWDDEGPQRRAFSIKVRRIEWLRAAGTDTADKALQKYDKDVKVPAKMPRSRCRVCGKPLSWGDGTYNFDHYDNNSVNCSQRNCFLVCRNDHGKATKTKLIRQYNRYTGELEGHKTIKRKVGYKKTPREPTRRTVRKPAKKLTRKPTKKTAKKSARKIAKKPTRKTSRTRR